MIKLKILLQFKYLIIILSFILSISIIIKLNKKEVINNHFILKIESINYENNNYTINLSNKYLSYFKGDFNYHLGDYVEINGNLIKPSNNTIPNLFNYKDYLKYKEIDYILEINDIKLYKSNNIIYKIKDKIRRIMDFHKSKSYLYAFIFGDTNYIDKDIKISFNEMGISHLFAISGTHISLLTIIINYLYKKKKLNKYIFFISTNLIVLFYMFLTNYLVSLLRILLFFNLSFFNKKKYSNTQLFIIVTMITLIINPYYFFQTSFRYSYLISFFLIKYNYLITGSYIKKIFKISILAVISSFPITILNNYEINLLSIIYNLFFVPLISFIIFPLSILSLLFPFIDNLLIIIINMFQSITLSLSKIDILTFIFMKPSILVIIIYYVFLLLSIKKRKIGILLIILIIIYYNINDIRKEKYLLSFDVNEGDNLVLKNDNKTILIDTGGKVNKNYSDNTISYLKSEGIRKIDYMILTHGDYDHMGEAISIINNYKVNKVILNCGPKNELEQDLIKVLNKKKIKYYSCIKELKVNDIKLEFLNTKEYDNENDNSSVIYTIINNKKILLMGDASSNREQDIINKYNLSNIDILKVGHHGSSTSSSSSFINRIKPKYSIISVGKNNKYGHPNKEVLNNLSNSKIIRTDINGSILFNLNNSIIKVFPP